MLLKFLIIAITKDIWNNFFYNSPVLINIHKKLTDNIFSIFLEKLVEPITFAFRDNQFSIPNKCKDEVNCIVIISLNDLFKLYDIQQFYSLIYHNILEIEDNLRVVNNHIMLLNLSKFDLTELLAFCIRNDIIAKNINKIFNNTGIFLRKKIRHIRNYFSEIITEEWRIIPGPLEISWFIEEIINISYNVTKLLKRLEILEKVNDVK